MWVWGSVLGERREKGKCTDYYTMGVHPWGGIDIHICDAMRESTSLSTLYSAMLSCFTLSLFMNMHMWIQIMNIYIYIYTRHRATGTKGVSDLLDLPCHFHVLLLLLDLRSLQGSPSPNSLVILSRAPFPPCVVARIDPQIHTTFDLQNGAKFSPKSSQNGAKMAPPFYKKCRRESRTDLFSKN